jgi:hypothetical protein
MCEDFAPNFGDKITGYCITTTHRLTLPFSQHDCRPHLPHFSLFLRLKIKLKVLHFDTIEVMEAEFRAVLNTLDFPDAFQNSRSAGNAAYERKGTSSLLTVTSRPKVSFCPDGSTTYENYISFFVCFFKEVVPVTDVNGGTIT